MKNTPMFCLKKTYTTVIVTAASLCVPFFCSAEETIHSGKVVISAAGYAQEVQDAPASITVITAEELEKKSASSLTEALRGTPGLDIMGGSNGDISIRGMESDKVLIMVDGRRQNGTGTTRKSGIDQGQANRWIPPVEAIERIEIIRGPMSTLYGSEAIGGVINIITKKAGSTWTGTISTFGELRDNAYGESIGSDLYISGPIIPDKLGIQLYGDISDRGEDKVLDGNARHKNQNGTAKFWFTPFEEQEFMFGINRQSQHYRSTPGKSIDIVSSKGTANTLSTTDYDRTQYDFGYNGTVFGGTLSLDAYREEYTSEFSASSGAVEILNHVAEAKYNFSLGNHILLAGFAFKNYELEDSGYYTTIVPGGTNIQNTSADMHEISAFLEDEYWVSDNISLTAGLRYDHNSEFGGHWTPRFYGVWNFLPDWTLKGGVAWGFKSPTLIQINPLFGMSQRNGAITRGNENLDPETSINYELGVYYTTNALSGSITAFYTDYKDKIANTGTNGLLDENGDPIPDPLTGKGLSTYFNIAGAKVYGLELALSYTITDNLLAKANYTYTHSEITSGVKNLPYTFTKYDGLVGSPLVAMPKHLANITLEWVPIKSVSTFASLEYRGKEYYANFGQGGIVQANEDTTLTTDLGISWEAYQGLTISAVAYNIFNDMRDNTAEYSYADDGRSLWLKISKTF